jgi:hypothetical protein
MTRRKKIYIVLRGEKGEGGDVLKVFAEFETAIEQAPTLRKPCFGPWKGGLTPGEGTVVASWKSGVDWLEVQEWSVE